MDIRKLHPDDASVYRELRIEAARDPSFGSDPMVEAAISVELLRQVLGTSVILGAFEGRNLLGVVGMGESEMTTTATLFGLFVTVGARNRGVGRTLVRTVVARATDDSRLSAVELFVEAGNEIALSLYETEGFIAMVCEESTNVRMLLRVPG